MIVVRELQNRTSQFLNREGCFQNVTALFC